MAHNERLCMKCTIPMKKTFITYKGIKFEARECPKCKEKIFTEDLTLKAITKLEARKVESEYNKHPIKIGNSWGITFPKEVAEVFGLNNSKVNIRVHPLVEKGKIEISLGTT